VAQARGYHRGYHCHYHRHYQVRFLWRLDFKRLRRLCLFIFKRRFFLRLPISEIEMDSMWKSGKANKSPVSCKGFYSIYESGDPRAAALPSSKPSLRSSAIKLFGRGASTSIPPFSKETRERRIATP